MQPRRWPVYAFGRLDVVMNNACLNPSRRLSRGPRGLTVHSSRSLRTRCALGNRNEILPESPQAPVGQFAERLTRSAIRIDGQFENRDCLEVDYVVFRFDRGAIGAEVPLLPYDFF